MFELKGLLDMMVFRKYLQYLHIFSPQYLGVVQLLPGQGLGPTAAHPAQLCPVEGDQSGGARLQPQLVHQCGKRTGLASTKL